MSRPKNSHTSRSTTTEAVVMTQAGSGRRRASVSGSAGAAGGDAVLPAISTMRISMHRRRVGVQRLPDAIAGVGEFLGAARATKVAARTRQRHLHDLLDPPLAHHHDAVGDQRRLVE